jgi:SAM-dependent methyltransferase
LCLATDLAAWRIDLAEYQVRRCRACGLEFVIDNRSQAEIEASYERDIYADYFAAVTAEVMEQMCRDNVDLTARYAAGPGRLLDVGCGRGLFLQLMQARGWEVFGLDISSVQVREARTAGLANISLGTVEEYPEGALFDLITLWSVLEHVPQPARSLAACARLLSPGGLLVIAVPNGASLLNRLAKVMYFGSAGRLDKPIRRLINLYHINSFTPSSLESAAWGLNLVLLDKVQTERYVTRYCLNQLNLPLRLSLWGAARLGRVLSMEEAIVCVFKNQDCKRVS